jgi:sensor domain CHASE-containing protein
MDKTVQLAADNATVTNNLRRRIEALEATIAKQTELMQRVVDDWATDDDPLDNMAKWLEGEKDG